MTTHDKFSKSFHLIESHSQTTPRFYLTAVEKAWEGIWYHHYVKDRKWWTGCLVCGHITVIIKPSPHYVLTESTISLWDKIWEWPGNEATPYMHAVSEQIQAPVPSPPWASLFHCASTSYDIDSQWNGRDVFCSTYHVMNEPRSSVQIPYCKQQMRKAWEQGYFSLLTCILEVSTY